MRADLHLHSYYSDGVYPPGEVVARAHAAGLELIALTDHDSLGGVAEAEAAAQRLGLRFIRGVELTATWQAEDLHILGYFAAPPGEALESHLRQIQAFRRQRLETALERLRQRGLRLESRDLAAAACCESLTTAHLARLLVDRGYASSQKTARRRFLSPDKGIVPPFEVTAAEVISVIHASKGLAIWAHPNPRQLRQHLGDLVSLGLDGLETHNGRRSWSPLASELARKFGLLETAGSDWHGEGALEATTDNLGLEAFLRRMNLSP